MNLVFRLKFFVVYSRIRAKCNKLMVRHHILIIITNQKKTFVLNIRFFFVNGLIGDWKGKFHQPYI